MLVLSSSQFDPEADIRSEGASLTLLTSIALGITRAHDGDYDHTNIKYTLNRCARLGYFC
jgi:hypothetical protein